MSRPFQQVKKFSLKLNFSSPAASINYSKVFKCVFPPAITDLFLQFTALQHLRPCHSLEDCSAKAMVSCFSLAVAISTGPAKSGAVDAQRHVFADQNAPASRGMVICNVLVAMPAITSKRRAACAFRVPFNNFLVGFRGGCVDGSAGSAPNGRGPEGRPHAKLRNGRFELCVAPVFACVAGSLTLRHICRDAKSMNTPARLDAALKSLVAALDQLEAACERRLTVEAEQNDLREEFAVLQDDRTRLGVELDAAIARTKSLELANDEVARRLQKASTVLKTMLSHPAMGEH